MKYTDSWVIKDVIERMKTGEILMYYKKTKSARISSRKIVGISFRCLLNHKLIQQKSETETDIFYNLTYKGISTAFKQRIIDKIKKEYIIIDFTHLENEIAAKTIELEQLKSLLIGLKKYGKIIEKTNNYE
jgi:hypothetical protein